MVSDAMVEAARAAFVARLKAEDPYTWVDELGLKIDGDVPIFECIRAALEAAERAAPVCADAALAVAVEMNCGLTIDGERVLCDDPRADEKRDRCECRAAAAAAIAAYERAAWRPIAEAPRDGTEVDLWTTMRGRVPDVRWRADKRANGWLNRQAEFETIDDGDATHYMRTPTIAAVIAASSSAAAYRAGQERMREKAGAALIAAAEACEKQTADGVLDGAVLLARANALRRQAAAIAALSIEPAPEEK